MSGIFRLSDLLQEPGPPEQEAGPEYHRLSDLLRPSPVELMEMGAAVPADVTRAAPTVAPPEAGIALPIEPVERLPADLRPTPIGVRPQPVLAPPTPGLAPPEPSMRAAVREAFYPSEAAGRVARGREAARERAAIEEATGRRPRRLEAPPITAEEAEIAARAPEQFPLSVPWNALFRDMTVGGLGGIGVKALDFVGGFAGLEAHPAMRSFVDLAHRQRRAEQMGDAPEAYELARGLTEFVGTIILLRQAGLPTGQGFPISPQVRAIMQAQRPGVVPLAKVGPAVRRAPEAVRGVMEAQAPGIRMLPSGEMSVSGPISRVTRRALEDAGLFGAVETVLGAGQAETWEELAARQRAGMGMGLVYGGGLQTIGELVGAARVGAVLEAARRNLPPPEARAPAEPIRPARRVGREPPAPEPTAPAEPPPERPVAPVERPLAAEPAAEAPGLRRRLADLIDPGRKAELAEAYRDPMTGLPNQSAFERARPRLDADPEKSVVSFDVVNFKAINDALGREAGDAYLRDVGRAIAEVAQDFGMEVRDVFDLDAARAGGDEFGAAPSVDDADEFMAAVIAEMGETRVEGTDYVVKLRGAVGNTWAEANAALREIKAAEEGPRARPTIPEPTERRAPTVPEAPPAEGEYITEAVVVVDGVEFGAPTHAQALAKAIETGQLDPDRLTVYNPEGINTDLFRTNTGELIDRFQASERFGKAAAESLEEIGVMRRPPGEAAAEPGPPSIRGLGLEEARGVEAARRGAERAHELWPAMAAEIERPEAAELLEEFPDLVTPVEAEESEYRWAMEQALEQGRVQDARALYDEAIKEVDDPIEDATYAAAMGPDTDLEARIRRAEAEAATQMEAFPLAELLEEPPVPAERKPAEAAPEVAAVPEAAPKVVEEVPVTPEPVEVPVAEPPLLEEGVPGEMEATREATLEEIRGREEAADQVEVVVASGVNPRTGRKLGKKRLDRMAEEAKKNRAIVQGLRNDFEMQYGEPLEPAAPAAVPAEAPAERLEVGDIVEPLPGSDIPAGMGGRVQHIKEQEGRRRIKTDQSGNLYFYEDEFQLYYRPPAGAGAELAPEEVPSAELPAAARGEPAGEPPGPVPAAEVERPAGEPPERGRPRREGVAPEPREGAPAEAPVQPRGVEEPAERVGGVAPEERPGGRAERPRVGREPGGRARPDRGVRGLNYSVEAPEDLGIARSLRVKATDNMEAIRLLKEIEAADRPATREEQQQLARYVGWGGMPQMFEPWQRTDFTEQAKELKDLLTDTEYEAARASTPNAHYTSPEAINAIWDAVRQFGYDGGRILEPGMGAGYFLSLAPKDLAGVTRFSGVELDSVTGRIARLLFPESDIRVEGFEDMRVPDGFFDAAVGNVPFGNYRLHDPLYNKHRFSIHNYFFAKSMDKVRPGGVVAFITSRYTMDAEDPAIRRYLAERADLIGAIRLPKTAFKKVAGTDVVTDIIFLRKRFPGEPAGGEPWEQSLEMQVGDATPRVNQYYHGNPTKVLGNFDMTGTMYAGQELTVNPSGDLAPQLAEAVESLPRGIMEPAPLGPTDIETPQTIVAPTEVKNGALTIQNGKLYRNDQGNLTPATIYDGKQITGKTLERVKLLVGLRDATREVLRAQLEDLPDKEIHAAQKKLNRLYDGFVKRFGRINKLSGSRQINLEGFREDPDAPLVAHLEHVDADTDTYEKAGIFSQRVIRPPKPVESVDNAEDALTAVLAEKGRVDLARMAELTALTEAHLIEALEGRIFENPATQQWESADLYLSGNVRDKLKLAQGAAKADPRFKINVQALEKVQPEDLKPSEIHASLGAPWIPPSDIQQFIADLINQGDTHGINVFYTPQMASWRVDVTSWVGGRAANTRQWGTERAGADKLIQRTLSMKEVKVYDPDPDGGRGTLNVKETAAANAKLEEIRARFAKWVWENPERATRLHREYNDNYHNQVPFAADGSHLTFPGMAEVVNGKPFVPRPHQRDNVWRVMQLGNSLLAHVVGSGKTWIMVAAGMELKRIGLITKPMYAVPKKILGQFAREFIEFYPAARVLVATKDDVSKEGRKAFFAKVANNEWDAVIIAHPSFGRLPMSGAFEEQFLRKEMQLLEEAMRDMEDQRAETRSQVARNIVKRIETAKDNMEARIKELEARDKKDDIFSFEELGIDMLFVDEAHRFKNLYAPTQMERNPLGRPSQRAMDLYMKTEYLNTLNPGRGVVFATGTPISNTIGEMYTMLRYLAPKELSARNMARFDAWAQAFGELETRLELRPEGGFRMHTRFSRFKNVPELGELFRSVADVQTAGMLNLPTPGIRGGKPEMVLVPASPEVRAYQQVIVRRAEAIRSRSVPPEVDNMLKLTMDGRKAALDLRLVDPNAPDLPDSKFNVGVDQVFQRWEKYKKQRQTQLVFLDLGTPKPKKKAPKLATFLYTAKKGWIQERGAEVVTIEGLEQFEFKVHRAAPPDKGWLVTESQTGLEVSKGTTKANAVLAATERLQAAGVEKTQAAIERGLEGAEDRPPQPAAQMEAEEAQVIDLYADMKQKLVARGVPEKEIAFIQDAKNEIAEARLHQAMRQGKVRILIGSTEMMGEGMNVQNRLQALHHFDVQYRPKDIEQREGRILRQGNENEEVEILRYVTEGSFDGYMWQLVATKGRSIAQVMRAEVGVRSVEDVDERALTYAEIMAISTGNPLVMEKAEVDAEVMRLDQVERSHIDRQFSMRQELAAIPVRRASLEAQLEDVQTDLEQLQDTKGDAFSITLAGQTYNKRPEAAKVLHGLITKLAQRKAGSMEFGRFAGLDLRAKEQLGAAIVFLQGKWEYETKFGFSTTEVGALQAVEYLPERVHRMEKATKDGLEALWTREKDLNGIVNRPFEQAEKLEKLRARQLEIDKELDLDKRHGDAETTEGAEDVPPEGRPPAEDEYMLVDEQPVDVPALERGDPDPGSLDEVHMETGVQPPIGIQLPGIDYGADLFQLARELETPARYKHLQKAHGRFRPEDQTVQLTDVRDIHALAHEIAHALDWRLSGDAFPRSIVARFGGHVPKGMGEKELRAELVVIAQLMRPVKGGPNNLPKYRKRHSELMADYYSLYLLDADRAAELAPNVTEGFHRTVVANPKIHGPVQATLNAMADVGPADEVPEIRPIAEPTGLIPEGVEGDYTDVVEAAVKGMPRHLRWKKIQAGQQGREWEKVLSEEELEDLGAAIEGIGNLRTGKTAEQVQEGLTAAQKKLLPKVRYATEQQRQDINEFMREMGPEDYIKYIENYLFHLYVGPRKAMRPFAARWSRKVPSAKQRKLPTLQDAVDAGLTPLTQNVAKLHRAYAEINWRGAINLRLVHDLKNVMNADGLPIIMKPKDAPPDWEVVDHPAIRRVYAHKTESGATVLWTGGAAVDPGALKYLRQLFEQPLTGSFVRGVELVNAFAKQAAFTFSLFHHFALTESAQAALARIWNPVRGVVLFGPKLRSGVALGAGIKITQPHREGLALLKNKNVMRDLVMMGVNLDPIPDLMVGRVMRAIEEAETRVREHPILGQIPGLDRLVRGVRKFKQGWDKALWNNYYTGLKAYVAYSLVVEQMARMPDDATPAQIRAVKEKIGELTNDMFGGQEWEGKFWLTPRGRQLAHVLIMAPDWTLSNINVAGKTLTQAKDPVARRILWTYWRNMLLSVLGGIATANRFCGGQWSWENEPDHKLDIDVTCIMRRLPWTTQEDIESGRRWYIRPGKQFREVTRYLTDPMTIIGHKMSPVMHVLFEQMTGHQAGQAGWEMPWVRKELNWYESITPRVLSAMEKFTPFALRGSNFGFTFPMSRGMSWYKAQKAYEDIIRSQVDPSLYDRLMPADQAKDRKEEIDRAAELNGLDALDLYKQANSMVRSRYYGEFWKAIDRENLNDAERIARILVDLGVMPSHLRGSAERRGIEAEETIEGVQQLLRQGAGRGAPELPRPPGLPRPPRRPRP